MIDTEMQRMVNEGLGNFVADQLEKNLPVTASFRGCGLRFEVCGTENEGMIKLEYYAPGQVYGQLGVYRKGTDRMYSNFISAVTAEEMIRYLRDPATHREWLEQISHLSESVDDYWA